LPGAFWATCRKSSVESVFLRAGQKLERCAEELDEDAALPKGPGLANLLAWAAAHPRGEGDVDPEEERSSFWHLLQEAKAERAAKDLGGEP
jgi:hypothetical protein